MTPKTRPRPFKIKIVKTTQCPACKNDPFIKPCNSRARSSDESGQVVQDVYCACGAFLFTVKEAVRSPLPIKVSQAATELLEARGIKLAVCEGRESATRRGR